MIKFRQKEFVVPVLAAMGGVGGAALMAGGTVISAAQGKKANKIAERQGEEAAAEQARANREMERIARQQAADQKRALKQIAKQNQNPTIVPMMDTVNAINNQPPMSSALDYPQQNSYSNTSILSNLSQKSFAKVNMKAIGQTGYDVIKGVRNSSGNVLTGKWLRNGLAMGAGMTGINYLVDKGIQIDRKRSGLPELEQKEITEKEKNKKKRGLVLAGLAAGATIAGGVAAKRGNLGTGWKNWADKNLTKQSLLTRAKTEPKKMGKALKDNALNGKSLLLGGAFAAPTIMGYVSEKNAIKDQIKDQEKQKSYSEDDNEKKSGSLLKKAAIGTALAAGTIAAGRRGYLGAGMQKGTGNLIARTGKVFKSQRLQDIGAKSWGEGAARARANKMAAREFKKTNNGESPSWYEFGKKSGIKTRAKEIQNASTGKATDYENIYKKHILTRQSKAIDAVKHPLRTVLSGADKAIRLSGQGGSKSAKELTENIRKQGQISGNKGTEKVANFLGNHKTIAVAGSLGVGSLVFKPFTWGDKVVRGGAKAVDKNAFAYENRNQEEVQ